MGSKEIEEYEKYSLSTLLLYHQLVFSFLQEFIYVASAN